MDVLIVMKTLLLEFWMVMLIILNVLVPKITVTV